MLHSWFSKVVNCPNRSSLFTLCSPFPLFLFCLTPPPKFQKAIALPVFPFRTISPPCLKAHREGLSCFRFHFAGNQDPGNYSPPSHPEVLSGCIEDEGIFQRNVLKKAETASLVVVMISLLDLLFHPQLSGRGGRMSWEETWTCELSAESIFSFCIFISPLSFVFAAWSLTHGMHGIFIL